MIDKLLNPFNWQPEEYEPQGKQTHIHDMLCTCQSRRCFGYTPIRWRRELSIE